MGLCSNLLKGDLFQVESFNGMKAYKSIRRWLNCSGIWFPTMKSILNSQIFWVHCFLCDLFTGSSSISLTDLIGTAYTWAFYSSKELIGAYNGSCGMLELTETRWVKCTLQIYTNLVSELLKPIPSKVALSPDAPSKLFKASVSAMIRC